MVEPLEPKGDQVKMKNPRLISILLYVLGALLLCRGVLDVLVWKNILSLPTWLSTALSQVQAVESLRALAFWANTGVFSVGLGFWTMVTAYWVSRKMPGHMVMAMVVLTLAVLIGGMTLLRWAAVPSSFDPLFWPDYLEPVMVLLGVFTTILMIRSSSFQSKQENSD